MTRNLYAVARLDLLVGDRPRATRARLIKRTIEPVSNEPRPPLRHAPALNTKPLSDLGVRPTARTGQHDPRPQRQRLSGLRPTRPPPERVGLSLAENQLPQLRIRHTSV